MALTAGTRLGPYEILAPLGAGGMGEVYRARDTRLDRTVAIKLLPSDLAKDDKRLRLFQQESRSIAALNHPHICQIYDVGPDYLVLEYIDGVHLQGPLPIDQALRFAIQIASALESAHKHGILHRDLKPGNVLVANSGAKLLDFGLSKMVVPHDGDATRSIEGVVLGTAGYMSPEQAQAKPLDERSDIFSFGAVLYEILSGRPAFPGESVADVLSAVLRDEPAPLKTPEPVSRVVMRCLSKAPSERFQSMAEVRAALEECLAQPSAPLSTWRQRFLVPAAIVLTVLLGIAAVRFMLRRNVSRSPVAMRQLTTNSVDNPIWSAVISPDGKYLAYGDLAGIQVRLISTGESHLLPKPASLSASDTWFPVAWLPDGTHVLANSISSSNVAAWIFSLVGGAALPLRDNAQVQSVSPDGSLVAFTTGSRLNRWASASNRRLMSATEIWVMSPQGENAKKIATAGELTWFDSVRWSPDGSRLAYQKLRHVGQMAWDYAIESFNLNGGSPTTIFSKRVLQTTPGQPDDLSFPSDFRWLPDGSVIFAAPEAQPNGRNTNLWRLAVDPDTGKPEGEPRRITDLAGFHMEGFSASANGKKLVFESSADQSHIVVGVLRGNSKLTEIHRLTLDERLNVPFDWTPDSKAVVFNSDRTGTFLIYKQALDEGVPELIPTGSGNVVVARTSSDGRALLYTVTSTNPDTVRLMRVPFAGGAPQPLFATKINNFSCPRRPEASCVAGEGISEKEYLFLAFDPETGTQHELFRVPRSMTNINWTISPDSSHLAMTGTGAEGQIEIRSLAGQVEKTIQMKGWSNPSSVDWTADGTALLVSNTGLMQHPTGAVGATLLRVDPNGRVQPLWDTRGGRYTWAIPSPDGKYLAIREPGTERNAWMIDNF